MQIELSIINQENEVVMCSSGVDEAVLATKKYAFQAGDKFKVVTAEKQLVYVQLDNALGSSLVYLSKASGSMKFLRRKIARSLSTSGFS